jgi:hypothetical protein
VTDRTRARFILRYVAAGPKPAADVARIRAVPRIDVLDESDRMLLVEGVRGEVDAALASCPGWELTVERSIPIPNPRPKLKGGPR